MKIVVQHQNFKELELENGELRLILATGAKQLLQEKVKDFCASIFRDILHVVTFCTNNTVWHFTGNEHLEHQKITDNLSSMGSRLICDGTGGVHLFYLINEAKGQGATLYHRTFKQEWSQPMVVSRRVYADASSISTVWGQDKYLHAVYCSYGDSFLFYRIYDEQTRMWSGAIPFSRNECGYPQFSSFSGISLSWIETDKQYETIKLITKNGTWSQPFLLSQTDGNCTHVGYSLADEEVRIFWRHNGKLWARTIFPQIEEMQEEALTDYDYQAQVVNNEAGASWTVAVYVNIVEMEEEVELEDTMIEEIEEEAEKISSPEQTPEPIPEPTQLEQEEERAKKEEEQLQAAFIEQAFRVQVEWEQLRSEYSKLSSEFHELQAELQKVRDELRDVKDSKQDIPMPDFSPITLKVDRLDRRLLKNNQEQESFQKHIEENVKQINQMFYRLNRRIGALEEAEEDEKTKRPWWRFSWR